MEEEGDQTWPIMYMLARGPVPLNILQKKKKEVRGRGETGERGGNTRDHLWQTEKVDAGLL